MAHLEGITNGLLLMGIATISSWLTLTSRQFKWLFYSSLTFGWLFTLPAIANAWWRTRGLTFGGGPFGDRVANSIIYLFGWPAMIGVRIAFALLAWGAWKHYRQLPEAYQMSHAIEARKIPFDFSDGVSPVWHSQQREWSHMVNGASLAIPRAFSESDHARGHHQHH